MDMVRKSIGYQGQHLPMPLVVKEGEMVFRGILSYKTHEETQTGIGHTNLKNVNDNITHYGPLKILLRRSALILCD